MNRTKLILDIQDMDSPPDAPWRAARALTSRQYDHGYRCVVGTNEHGRWLVLALGRFVREVYINGILSDIIELGVADETD